MSRHHVRTGHNVLVYPPSTDHSTGELFALNYTSAILAAVGDLVAPAREVSGRHRNP